MNTLLYLLTMLVATASAEVCLLRRWYPRRGLIFCIIVVGGPSGIFWATFFFMLFEIGTTPALTASNEFPPVGSGFSWEILLFLIWTLIVTGATIVSAALAAVAYHKFKQ